MNAPANSNTAAHAEAEEIVKQLLTEPPQNPYPLYARLREIDPIHRASVGDFWTLTRYKDIALALKDKRFVRDFEDMQRRHTKGKPIDYTRPFTQNQQKWFVFSNPPDYVRKRALYNTAFNRPYVEGLRPLMAKFTNEVLDEMEKRGEMEVVEDLGFGLTVRVISYVLGLPDYKDSKLLVEWGRVIAQTFDPVVTEEIRKKADVVTGNLKDFLSDLIATQRRNPGDNLLGRLIIADKEGILSEEEMMANVPLVFSAGLETTTHFIGNSVYSFLRNADQWELFKSDPEGLVENAIEELLRYESSVQADAPLRLASEDIEISGITIAKGEGIVPFYGSANRDQERYASPDRLDIRRQDIRTLGFGGGVHICLGQHIARTETQVALTILARRFPHIKIQGDEPTWRPGVTNRSLNALHVKLA